MSRNVTLVVRFLDMNGWTGTRTPVAADVLPRSWVGRRGPPTVPGMPEYVNFMGVLVIAFISPIVSAVIPAVRVPTIVIEFVLAVIVGPDVLGWIKVDNPLDVLSVLALAFLLFTAGTEVELSSLRGAVLGRAAVAYAISFAIAGVVSVLLHQADIVMTP